MTTKFPPETKVKVAGVFSFLTSTVVLSILSAISSSDLVQNLPDWASVLAGAAITAGVTYITAWNAKHSPRPLPRSDAAQRG